MHTFPLSENRYATPFQNAREDNYVALEDFCCAEDI